MRRFLIASGDFRPGGGMDRANYELAWHLAERVGAAVELMAYRVAPPLAQHPQVRWTRLPLPLGSYALGERSMWRSVSRRARQFASEGGRVVTNGGNALSPDTNWVHAVHAAWELRDSHAPLLFKFRARWMKRNARHRERDSIAEAKVVIANSENTRKHLIKYLLVPEQRIRVVYLGVDGEANRPADAAERRAMKRERGLLPEEPLIVFVGALGHDRNKGADVAVAAWQRLVRAGGWTGKLLIAGSGRELKFWRGQVQRAGLESQVLMPGHVSDLSGWLMAADLLISPTHYDSYGLAVHEALCCGVPAIVSRCAGVAERYTADMDEMLLDDPSDPAALAERMLLWRDRQQEWRDKTLRLSTKLREHTWEKMAIEFLAAMGETA